MLNVVRARWRALAEGLWFTPSLIVVLMGALAFGVVRIDVDLLGPHSPWVFGGGAQGARTVLSTIAGSLITVAGLTFSVTIVALQLASSQFSPRVLPNFLGDRITQLTVGAFVGIFVFCLIGLRAVGVEGAFVPRLTVTVASALGVGSVILLIVFIHHVSTLIQVSHVAARIGRLTLSRLDSLYPGPFGRELPEDAGAVLEEWRASGGPATISPARPGFVEQIALDDMAAALPDGARLLVPIAPGDFVAAETPVAEVWPAEAAERAATAIRRAVAITGERSLVQDADFGVRQLADIALRAISPSVNDPTTAVTCIGYVQAVLERLAGREFPSPVRRQDGHVVVVARRRSFAEYVEVLAEVGRYADGDARVVEALLRACRATAAAARTAGAQDRADAAAAVAERIAGRARREAGDEHDRERVDGLLASVRGD